MFSTKSITLQEQTPKNASFTKEPLTHLVSNNNEFKIISKQNADFLQKFNILEATQDDNENLSNESVNILRISDSKLDLEADLKPFNYSSFDRANDSLGQNVFKVPDQVPESSCERVNQIVKQSMERTARSAMEKSEMLLKNDYVNLSTMSDSAFEKKSKTENEQTKSDNSTFVAGDSVNDSKINEQTSSTSISNSRVLGSIYYKPWPVTDTTSVFKQQSEESLNESQLKLDSSLFNIPKNFNNFENFNNQTQLNDEAKNVIDSAFPFDRPLDDEDYRNNLFSTAKDKNEKGFESSKRIFLALFIA